MQESAGPVKTVLVVEDYADSRFMLGRLLEMTGYRVVEAADGREAVAVAERECPDLVLMDLQMPVMDGIEATKHLRGRPETSHMPIIAVTAHCADPSWRGRAMAAGCTECVGKPVDFERLHRLLDRVMVGR